MYKLLLIWRYMIKKRVALIAVAAVALLVMMVLVVLSIMTGLLEDTRRRNHRWAGDVIVSRDSLVGFPRYDVFLEVLADCDEVAAATPVIRTFGLEGRREHRAVELYGIKGPDYAAVTGFEDTLYFQKGERHIDFVVPENGYHDLTTGQRQRGCITGIYLLSKYAGSMRKDRIREIRERWLRPELALPWELTVFALNARGLPTGSGSGEHQVFWYVDDSDTGLVDIDDQAIYVDFEQLQHLCYMDGSDGYGPRVNEVRVKIQEGVRLNEGKAIIERCWEEVKAQAPKAEKALLEDVRVETWKEFRRSRIAPAEKERTLLILVFAMMGLVAVFIIFAIFYMIVTEKVKDLGIIKSVGGSGRDLAQIFLGYGLVVGMLGGITGTVAGAVIVQNSNDIEGWLTARTGFRLWDPAVYAIERIPDTVNWEQAGCILLAAIGAALAGAWLPARRAARLEVIKALRVE